jgi:acid phosphatase (class A)
VNGTLAHAISDAELNCNRISEVLGDAEVFNREPQVLTFLNRAARESTSLSGTAKNYWRRTRPYAYSSAVERHADMASDSPARAVDVGSAPGMAAARADLAHSSYPSGHSTFATVCAILLADMVPEKRAALYARALDFAHSRMVVGAHFPTDLEAGRLTGTVAAELLMQNAAFQHDFAAARISLRAALGLAPEPPPMEPPAVH